MPRYRTRSWRDFDPRSGGVAAPERSLTPVSVSAPPSQVRILGLDPGSRHTGFGVIECRGPDYSYVAHGRISVGGLELAERLRRIFDTLQALIGEHGPHEIAVERVFVNRNVDSALKLGHARGAALCAVPRGLPVFEYAPRAIKLALVGSGGAEKSQVAHMIRVLLHLQGRIAVDASDALAIAICHAHTRQRTLLESRA